MTEPSSPPPAKSLLRSAGVVGAMTFISRLTGLWVQRTIGGHLGVGAVSDAYQVAWRLPNMLRRFTAEGTMTAAFLPTLTDVETQQGTPAAQAFVQDFLGSLCTSLLMIAMIGILLMTPITGLLMLGKLAPHASVAEQLRVLWGTMIGHNTFPPDVALSTLLSRIMFPYLALVSLTAGLAAVLNLRHRFALAASVSTFFNLTFLSTSLALLHWGPTSYRLPNQAAVIFALCVLAGGVVQWLVLLPAFWKLGFRLSFAPRFSNPSVRLALKRMLPGILAGGIHPINVFISQSLASQLDKGAQTVLTHSNTLGEFVLGLFAVSVATVSLPTMSRLAAQGDLDGVRSSLASALRGTAVMAIPGAVGMGVLAYPIVTLVYQTGHFKTQAAIWTAETMPFQALGILFIASSRISTQALNAMKDYRGPAQAALVGFACNICFSFLLMGPLGTRGMALANSLSAMAGLLYQTWRLRSNLHTLPYQTVFQGWFLFGTASAIMGVVAYYGAHALGLYPYPGFFQCLCRLIPLIMVCALLYLGLLMAFRVPEAQDVTRLIRRKLRI